jgi:hypothetical protein
VLADRRDHGVDEVRARFGECPLELGGEVLAASAASAATSALRAERRTQRAWKVKQR